MPQQGASHCKEPSSGRRAGSSGCRPDEGVLECSLRGRLKKERQSSDIAVIGDRVEVMRVSPGHGAIEAVLPRQSKLARRAAGTKGVWKEDVLVANLDQALLVFACAHPDFHPRMLDRYLVLTEASELETVIVANKVDTVGIERAHELFATYEQIGYRVIYTSTTLPLGLDELRAQLAGRISVVTGKSGVGKSSLLNTVQPGLHLATGAVSEQLHKGRHTDHGGRADRDRFAERRLCGRYAGHPRDRPVELPARRARLVLPRVPPVPRRVLFQRLHAHPRAGLWRCARRWPQARSARIATRAMCGSARATELKLEDRG